MVCELSCGHWKLNPGPQKLEVLRAKSSLQPHLCIFKDSEGDFLSMKNLKHILKQNH